MLRPSHTDFWNFSRNSWAWAFSDLGTFPCMVATAARTGANACPPSLLAILEEGERMDRWIADSAIYTRIQRGERKQQKTGRKRGRSRSGIAKDERRREWKVGCWPVTLGIGITVHKSRDAELSVSKFPFLRRKPAVAPFLSLTLRISSIPHSSSWLAARLCWRRSTLFSACCRSAARSRSGCTSSLLSALRARSG